MTTAITSNLTERAMLVNLSISQWSAVKNDKSVNREIAQKHGNSEDMGRFNKTLVPKDSLEKLRAVYSAARAEHYRRTLPWRDGGDRILSSAGYFEYAKVMRQFIQDTDTLVDWFCTNYPTYIAQARTKLNGLFNPADYPSVAEIRGKFGLRFDVFPLQSADDFRVELGSNEVSRIRQEIQASSDAMLNKAMADVWGRMKDVVGHMAERLKAYQTTADGKVLSTFRDSLVSNITDLLDVLPTLNLTNDPHVDEFAREIREYLTVYSPEALRNSETIRVDVASRADEILSKMAAFIA
jgi:hypothetical protein